MKTSHIVCFSGGHSSALVAIEVCRRFGSDRVVLLNHDINADVEDPDIKRFKKEVAEYLGLEITQANHSAWDLMDQFDVAREAGAFKVGVKNVICTHRLKTEPFSNWLRENHPAKDCIVYYGFDANEKARIQRRSGILGSQGYKSDYPLALWPRTIQSTNEVGIEPPLTYGVWKHANCIGCIKAGQQHWYTVFCLRPDIWARARLAEDDIGYSIMRAGFLEDLEPKFAKMRKLGIEPGEKIHPNRFWADARKHLTVLEADAKPCECVF